MKLLPSILGLVTLAVLNSCRTETAGVGDNEAPPPAPPSPEVVAALQSQPFGKNLLGATMVLSGGQFVSADLRSAPDYYLVHYSASW